MTMIHKKTNGRTDSFFDELRGLFGFKPKQETRAKTVNVKKPSGASPAAITKKFGKKR